MASLALICAGSLSLGATSSFAVTIQAQGIAAWSPSTATISPGESVEFKNTSGYPHGISWQTPPVVPSCTAGVPVNSSNGANWSGMCTFPQTGEYNFVCTVHPAMTGKVTASGPGAPVVTTGSASAITDTGATLNGNVNPSGQETTYYFKYGPTTSYGLQTTEQSAGNGSAGVARSAPITGLAAATTYHFQIVATNASGARTGSDQTFTTSGPPTPTTDPATNVGGSTATLAGRVNPRGHATTYHFKYGPTAAYGQETAPTPAGSGTNNVNVTAPISGLSSETTYHFQLVAENSSGTTMGADRTFTTFGAPLATTGQAAGVGDMDATLQGSVNPQGQPTTYHFEYGTTAAYGQETSAKPAGNGTSTVAASAPLTGLSPETTYHFRLVAENGSGTTDGVDRTFTTSATPPPPPPAAPPPAAPAPPPAPTVLTALAPDTTLKPKPRARTRDRTPTLKFRATVAGARYECSVDRGPFRACRSPFTSPRLKPGRHRIRVRAIVGGVSDPSPATWSFKVLGRARPRR